MKAHIQQNGVLVLVSENDTEAYALEKWFDDNTRTIRIKADLFDIQFSTFDIQFSTKEEPA